MPAPKATIDPDFVLRPVLDDGTKLVVRYVRPEDAPEFRRAFARLSPESRFRRFFGAVTSLSDELLVYLTDVDGQDHVALVATVETPDLKETGVGVARFIRVRGEKDVAEAAVTVVDDMQHHGIGRILLMTLADAARERGVRRFRAEVLSSNELVTKALEEAGAVVVRTEEGTVTFDIPIERAVIW